METARGASPLAKSRTDRKKTPGPDPQLLERMLYYLKLTREAESRIEQVLYRQGKIVGGVYVGRGQEAIGVGSAIQLVEGDVVLPSHRDFSCFLIRGFTLRQILCNWMGRANGPTRGRDNTLHIGDVNRGVIPIISHLGDTCPVACGVAMVLKRRGKNNVALVHFGEGTSSRGDVHEAMNMAGVMKLPVIFICNNNAYAYSTPTSKQYAVKDLAVRGAAYGMPGIVVDGNDILAVFSVVAEAIARGRRGEGPSFIECKTFRMSGHSAHDAAEYVPHELFEQWKQKDPIARFEKFLLAKRFLTEKQIERLGAEVTEQVDDAVAYAESSPLPEGASAAEGVYCGPDCWWKESSR
ncbi:MAG: thiamine pyrophosphate-dependent dehydrogenase E1 component subunit alpha [Acidobacteria bacterium]|nr:thiamine pyrophosphate-dependent dehydrogenase E1 component subunit alpha [Acidobacteriota bacterium]